MSHHNDAISIETIKKYRDDTISCLERQLQLLDDINSAGLVRDTQQNGGQTIINSDNFDNIKTVLREEIKKLAHFDVVLSVVGTMKSGKSTTINAIVGREIMPNRNRPMTALPTIIVHTPEQKEPLLTFNNPDVRTFIKQLQTLLKRNPAWKNYHELKENRGMQQLMTQIECGESFLESYHGEEAIFSFLARLNDLVRLTEILRHARMEEYRQGRSHEEDFHFPYDSCCNIDQLPMIQVAFSHLSNSEENEGRLILLDTPGPNEAGQNQLKHMLTGQLQRSSAVLLILDYTQLKSEAEQSVREQIEAIPDIDENRLFALVNKFDQQTTHSDDADTTKKMIHGDLLKDKIKLEHIYPVSAQQAYLANRMIAEISTTGEMPAFNQYSWVQDFAKRAFGAVTDEEEWNEYTERQIKKRCTKLIDNSRMMAPIRDAIIQTQHEAPRIAIRTALTKISTTLNDIHNLCEITFKVVSAKTEAEIQALQEKVTRLSTQVNSLGKIQEHVGDELKEITTSEIGKIRQALHDLEQETRIKIEDIFKKANETLNEQREKKSKKFLITIFQKQTREEREELNELIKKLELIQSKTSEEEDLLIFANNEERDRFYDAMTKIYRLYARAFMLTAEEIIDEGKTVMQETLSTTEQQCQQIFQAIDEEFRKDGFDLHLECPKIAAFQGFETEEFSYQRDMQKKTESKRIKETGLGAGIARGLGWIFNQDSWGYKNVDYTYYQDSKTAIQQQMFADFEHHVFSKIELEVSNILHNFSHQFVENYVGKVKREAEKLTNELQSAIDTSRDAQTDKESRRIIINQLRRTHSELHEDLQDIAHIFDIRLHKTQA